MAYALFVGLIFLLIFSIGISKKMSGYYISPVMALPASFIYSNALYLIYAGNFYEIQALGVLVILIAVSLFELGVIIGGSNFINFKIKSMSKNRQKDNGRSVFCLITVLFILGVISGLYHVLGLTKSTNLPLYEIYRQNFYLVDRGFLLHGWAWLYGLNMLNVPLCAIYNVRYHRKKVIILLYEIISICFLALKGDGYYILFPLLSAAVCSILEKHKIKDIIFIFGCLFIITIVFFITSYYFYFSTFKDGITKLFVYSSGSLVSFGKLVDEGIKELNLGIIFGSQFLKALRINVPTKSSIDITEIGPHCSTNVYSLFGTFYSDFGLIGVFFLSFFIGWLANILFKIYLNKKQSIGWLFLISQITSALFLAFFGNLFAFVQMYFHITLVFIFEKLLLNPTVRIVPIMEGINVSTNKSYNTKL